MSWESMRDIGLIVFGTGILATFGLGSILYRYLGFSNTAMNSDYWRRNDASPAVAAMVIDYLMRAGTP